MTCFICHIIWRCLVVLLCHFHGCLIVRCLNVRCLYARCLVARCPVVLDSPHISIYNKIYIGLWCTLFWWHLLFTPKPAKIMGPYYIRQGGCLCSPFRHGFPSWPTLFKDCWVNLRRDRWALDSDTQARVEWLMTGGSLHLERSQHPQHKNVKKYKKN